MWGRRKKGASCWFIMERVTDSNSPCTTWTVSQTCKQACSAKGFSLALNMVKPGTHVQWHAHTCTRTHTLATWCQCNNIRVGGDFKRVTNVWLRLSLPLSPAGSFDSPHPSLPPSLPPLPLNLSTCVPVVHTWHHCCILLVICLLNCCGLSELSSSYSRSRGSDVALCLSETSVGCVRNAVPWAPCVVSWPSTA